MEGRRQVDGPGRLCDRRSRATSESKAVFGDCQVHVEWASAEEVKGSGQGRSNSGVFLMGRYEVQVLDSYNNPTYFDGQCGAIYKQHPPLVNACRKPGEWQTYDIIWKAPAVRRRQQAGQPGLHHRAAQRRAGPEPLRAGRRYALQSAPEYKAHPDKGPIRLQYHGNPVKFRNIWVREIQELESSASSEPRITKCMCRMGLGA